MGAPRSITGVIHDRRVRDLLLQALVIVVIVGAAAWFLSNAVGALSKRGIATGWHFLEREAGFGIGEGLIPFHPSDTYLRAFVVGVLNTLKVSAVAIVLATVIGVVVGLMRLSTNLGVAKLAMAYVEVFRNTPQLLQIIFWYAVLTRLPGPRQSWRPLEGVFVSNRGIQLPWPAPHPGWTWGVLALLAAIAIVVFTRRRLRARHGPGGKPGVANWLSWLPLVVLPVGAWFAAGAPATIDTPALRGLNFTGGINLSPEFLALWLGLSLYIAAFVAEIVRSGLQSIGKGQVEAARSLGLTRTQITLLVLIPQALRVMVPPLTAQYVSLVKNSSLAVAIGYPELVSIANTTINQTGHTIEAILIMSAVYLFISLTIAILMNWYNRSVLLVER